MKCPFLPSPQSRRRKTRAVLWLDVWWGSPFSLFWEELCTERSSWHQTAIWNVLKKRLKNHYQHCLWIPLTVKRSSLPCKSTTKKIFQILLTIFQPIMLFIKQLQSENESFVKSLYYRMVLERKLLKKNLLKRLTPCQKAVKSSINELF